MRTVRTRLLALFVSALLAPPLLGDDLNPPSYRGDPLSTVQGWDFLTDQGTEGIQPDHPGVPLIIGDNAPALNVTFPSGAPYPSGATFGDVTWTAEGYRGGPLGDGILVFNVPNWMNNAPLKRLRVQVSYRAPEPNSVVFGFLGIPGTTDGVDVVPIVRVADTDPSLPEGVLYFYEDWEIFPGTDWEQVALFLQEDTVIDTVVIDTVAGAGIPVTIFTDGFESGDVSAWSSSVP